MSKEVSESAFEYLLAEILSLKLQKQQSEDELSIHLEKMGYEVGFRYIEKICPIQKVLSSEHLDIVKFVCKDLWEELFKKKVCLRIYFYHNSYFKYLFVHFFVHTY